MSQNLVNKILSCYIPLSLVCAIVGVGWYTPRVVEHRLTSFACSVQSGKAQQPSGCKELFQLHNYKQMKLGKALLLHRRSPVFR